MGKEGPLLVYLSKLSRGHGEGWVQARGHAPQRINEGDTVTADPGEEHWHGAGKTAPMAHIAVAVGETRWLEESPSPPQ